MGPRRRRSSSWRAAPAVGHSRRETKPCPHASSGREGPVRILANEGDGTDELPENVGFQRHSRAQLSADSNALAETINGLYKAEVIHRRSWPGLKAVELATLEWVHWYNQRRLLGPLGYISPAEAEEAYNRNQALLARAA